MNPDANPSLYRMLCTNIRTLEVRTYHEQWVHPKKRTTKKIGTSIGMRLIGLHDALPRSFQVILLFNNDTLAMEIVEILREYWDDLRSKGNNLPSLTVTIPANYAKKTSRADFDFNTNEPSQEEV